MNAKALRTTGADHSARPRARREAAPPRCRPRPAAPSINHPSDPFVGTAEPGSEAPAVPAVSTLEPRGAGLFPHGIARRFSRPQKRQPPRNPARRRPAEAGDVDRAERRRRRPRHRWTSGPNLVGRPPAASTPGTCGSAIRPASTAKRPARSAKVRRGRRPARPGTRQPGPGRGPACGLGARKTDGRAPSGPRRKPSKAERQNTSDSVRTTDPRPVEVRNVCPTHCLRKPRAPMPPTNRPGASSRAARAAAFAADGVGPCRSARSRGQIHDPRSPGGRCSVRHAHRVRHPTVRAPRRRFAPAGRPGPVPPARSGRG